MLFNCAGHAFQGNPRARQFFMFVNIAFDLVIVRLQNRVGLQIWSTKGFCQSVVVSLLSGLHYSVSISGGRRE